MGEIMDEKKFAVNHDDDWMTMMLKTDLNLYISN